MEEFEINIKEEITSPPPLQAVATALTPPPLLSLVPLKQKCIERSGINGNSGITISEYLHNNYPPSSEESAVEDIRYFTSSASMVALDASAENIYQQYTQFEQKESFEYPTEFIKMDDEEKKKVKRRMKNKISAQESRRRKKEYVDTLEARLKQKDQENSLLKDKVTELEEKYRNMVDELFALKQKQSRVQLNGIHKTPHSISQISTPHSISQISRATQTGTCLDCFENRNDGASNYDVNHIQQNLRKQNTLTKRNNSSTSLDSYSLQSERRNNSSTSLDSYYLQSESKIHHPERPSTFSPVTLKSNYSSFRYLPDDLKPSTKTLHVERSSPYLVKPYSTYKHSSYGRTSIPNVDTYDRKYQDQTSAYGSNNKTDSYLYDGRRSSESRKYIDRSFTGGNSRYSAEYFTNEKFTSIPKESSVLNLYDREYLSKYKRSRSDAPVSYGNKEASVQVNGHTQTSSLVQTTLMSPTRRTTTSHNNRMASNSSIMETSSLFSQLMNTEHLSSPSHT